MAFGSQAVVKIYLYKKMYLWSASISGVNSDQGAPTTTFCQSGTGTHITFSRLNTKNKVIAQNVWLFLIKLKHLFFFVLFCFQERDSDCEESYLQQCGTVQTVILSAINYWKPGITCIYREFTVHSSQSCYRGVYTASLSSSCLHRLYGKHRWSFQVWHIKLTSQAPAIHFCLL